MTLESVPSGRARPAEQPRCEFALCQQEAEYAVELADVEEVLVCSLHVTPVVTWGRPDGTRGAVIWDLVPPATWAG